jgi:hypothetical protein
MSQIIDLCEDRSDNGERLNPASVPSLPLSGKRPREHPYNENGPGDTNATGLRDFGVDLRPADEVEIAVSAHKKQRGVMKGERRAKKDAAGEYAQILKAVPTIEEDEDLEQTSRDDGSAREHSRKIAISRQWGALWEDHVSELADYRKIHGHCNVPHNYSKNKSKLSNWVASQRKLYNMHIKGKSTSMTDSRIQELESLGFEWKASSPAWGDRLSELADYRKIHGHCNVPQRNSENLKLATWVKTQRKQYKSHQEGDKSQMSLFRIEKLESLGFDWDGSSAVREDRMSELADYRKIHGHCNVRKSYSENLKLANWVATQRSNYKLYREGKTSHMTPSRIKELDSMGFDWETRATSWDDRLSELADYREIHGNCNVPNRYSENAKLGSWVSTQRCQYRLHRQGKASYMTLPHIQELESLGFEWKPPSAWEERFSELTEYRKIHGHCNVPKSCSDENVKLVTWISTQRYQYRLHTEGRQSYMTLFHIQELEDLGFDWNSSGVHQVDDDATRVHEKTADVLIRISAAVTHEV